MAIGCCGADFRPLRCESTPTHGVQYSATARPSTTAMTPGAVRAFEKSRLLIIA